MLLIQTFDSSLVFVKKFRTVEDFVEAHFTENM